MKDKWSFYYWLAAATSVLAMIAIWYKGRPFEELWLGRFHASCELSVRELALMKNEAGRAIVRLLREEGNIARDTIRGSQDTKVSNSHIHEIASKGMKRFSDLMDCEPLPGGKQSCAFYVWWGLGDTWLVSPPVFGVENAMKRPDIEKGPRFSPLLVALHDAPRKCVRLSNVGSWFLRFRKQILNDEAPEVSRRRSGATDGGF